MWPVTTPHQWQYLPEISHGLQVAVIMFVSSEWNHNLGPNTSWETRASHVLVIDSLPFLLPPSLSPSLLTTYLPTKPVAPNTVATTPLNEDRPPAPRFTLELTERCRIQQERCTPSYAGATQ